MSVIEQALAKARRNLRENPPVLPDQNARPSREPAPPNHAPPNHAPREPAPHEPAPHEPVSHEPVSHEPAPLELAFPGPESLNPSPLEPTAREPLSVSAEPFAPAEQPSPAHARQQKFPASAPRACEFTGLGEEYRLLKEKLLALRKKNPSMNMFMVTSPMRSEGKTLITCNLALCLAYEFDHSVLLIDADMRAPSCHRHFGIAKSKGISDCLLDGERFGEALIPTGIGRLSFLSAGRPVPHTAELFSSNLMRELLREVKTRYADRIIVIDTPPILPFAETRLLSRMVDGVLLAARENVTLKHHLVSAVTALEGCNLLGIVYNDAVNCGSDKEIFNLGHSY